jgi:tRNA A-37 threonylcarbamoyl transferase component Bud32
MSGRHVGVLPADDPLHRLLAEEVLAEAPARGGRAVFDVYQLDGSGTVFRYADRHSSFGAVGKFYGSKWLHGRQSGEPDLRATLMRREFKNLSKARELGFTGPPHRVVRPFSVSEKINCVLLEEYAPGNDLHFGISQAIFHGQQERLRGQLADLAWFLADLHNHSPQGCQVDPLRPIRYLEKMISQLAFWAIILPDERRRLVRLRDQWAGERALDGVGAVLIHGDATPTNFVFSGHDLAVIDLERLNPSDRAADLGRVAAELKHLFWLYTSDRWASEPYIQHFYASYVRHLPAAADTEATLTNRGRFYMGCDLLRISRNHWLDLGYRRLLVREAQECLTT